MGTLETEQALDREVRDPEHYLKAVSSNDTFWSNLSIHHDGYQNNTSKHSVKKER